MGPDASGSWISAAVSIPVLLAQAGFIFFAFRCVSTRVDFLNTVSMWCFLSDVFNLLFSVGIDKCQVSAHDFHVVVVQHCSSQHVCTLLENGHAAVHEVFQLQLKKW